MTSAAVVRAFRFAATGRIVAATGRIVAATGGLLLILSAGRFVEAAPQAPATNSPATLRAAIEDLMSNFGDRYAGGGRFLVELAEIEQRLQTARGKAAQQVQREFLALQRQALLANPLVNGRPILFVVRSQYAADHHNTATIFQTGEINTHKFRGPGAIKTIDLAHGGVVTNLLDVPRGVARDPDVSEDGRRILFAMRKDITDDYHLYEMKADGAGLRQLTFGSGVSDIDPVYLPDGRIVFTSSREPKYCMCNRHIMGNLFRMEADGSNLLQIGKNTLFEGHSSLLPDGRIVYDRWEYVDRNFGDAQGLWTCNPDGTNHTIFWGNNTKSPGAVLEARILPGSHRVIAVFGSCHDRPWGALAIIDRRVGLDGKQPVVRIWPAAAMDLVMKGNYDMFKRVAPKYEDPYPLSDKYFLCSRQTGRGEQMGLYLLDVFGNELLVHSEGAGCFDPMPLGSRQPPPTMTDRVHLDRKTGKFYVVDVYLGTGMERVKRGTVKYLRVVESPEKRFWSPRSWNGAGTQAPGMNWHDFNNKRILGTVEVEADGSAYFEIPANRFVFFQLLDEKGMMVQSMRSGTIIRPGETIGCVGCHDNRHAAAPNQPKMAIRRTPRPLKPWRGPQRIFSYTAEVQPVFDKHCVSCHDYGQPAGKKLNLAGDAGLIFNVSYAELWRKKQINVVGGGPADILPPYTWGSHTSKLVKVISGDHYGVKLDAESFDRIVTWIDVNAPYYPSYASAYPNNLYGRSPLADGPLAELSKLVGVNLKDQRYVAQISFDRPQLSPCLARFKNENDPRRNRALAIIRDGASMLAKQPRPDRPNFQLVGVDVGRNAKYGTLARNREALLEQEKEQNKKDKTAPN